MFKNKTLEEKIKSKTDDVLKVPSFQLKSIESIDYSDIKNELYQCIMDYFADQRLQKDDYLNRPNDVSDLMVLGKDKAKAVATKTLEDVKKSIGML